MSVCVFVYVCVCVLFTCPILNDINITNTITANSISTQGDDTLVSQLFDELEMKSFPHPVTCERIKGYFLSDTLFNLSKNLT